MNQQQGAVMLPVRKWRYSYHTRIDLSPITACLEMLSSSYTTALYYRKCILKITHHIINYCLVTFNVVEPLQNKLSHYRLHSQITLLGTMY